MSGARSVPVFDLFNPSGYRRELAVRGLSSATSPLLLAIFIRRLNDWVPQVRDAARVSTHSLTSKCSPVVVAEALWMLIPFRSTWERLTTVDTFAFDAILNSNDVFDSLCARIQRESAGPMLQILQHITKFEKTDCKLQELATLAISPHVRRVALKSLIEGRVEWIAGWSWRWIDKVYNRKERVPVVRTRLIDAPVPYDEALQLAASDRSVIVRRLVTTILISRRGVLSSFEIGIVKKMLCDKNQILVDKAKFIIQQVKGVSG